MPNGADNFPIPSSLEGQKQLLELYVGIAKLIKDFDDKLDEVKEDVEPMRNLAATVMDQVKNAGIKLSDTDSLLGAKLKEIKHDNKDWKNESKSLLDVLKSANAKMWTIIGALVVAIGLGIFNRFDPPEFEMPATEIENHYYHMPPAQKWQYDGEYLWVVVDGDTLWKKP